MSGRGSGDAEVDREVDRRRGRERLQARPRRREPGVGEHGDRQRVDRALLAQPEPASARPSAAPLKGGSPKRCCIVSRSREAAAGRRGAGPRAGRVPPADRPPASPLVEERALPGRRVGGEREADQLAVLLHAAAEGGERAAGPLDRRARPRPGPTSGGRRKCIVAERAERSGSATACSNAAQHQRHHVAAERPARRRPAVGDRAGPRRRRRPGRAQCLRRSESARGRGTLAARPGDV